MTTTGRRTTVSGQRASWFDSDSHRLWLYNEAVRLLDFYQYASHDPRGGFHQLEDDGTPRNMPNRDLFITTRIIHCYSLAHLMGKPGAPALIEHGMRHLKTELKDHEHGGWFWSGGPDGPIDSSKQHYGHAFVILAAASAMMAEQPGAQELMAEAREIHDRYFWSDEDGAAREEYPADWSELSTYRGQNGNMHLTEAYMAAYEATGDDVFLERAERIANKLINQLTRANGWRLAEHYTEHWEIDFEYNRDDPYNLFRPYGSTTGHWLEWSRLLLQLWETRGRTDDWMPEAAKNLFDIAVREGWDHEKGGFYFTVDWDGKPFNRDRYWWTLTEAIGAAAFLHKIDGDPKYEQLYRSYWDYADRYLIDHQHGGWFHQLDPDNQRTRDPWFGKPDLYHSFQACLIPLLPTDMGLALALKSGKLKLTG